jgi:hypothetical protein
MKRVSNVISGVTVLAAAAVFCGPQTIAFVKAGYPTDTPRREALDRCAAANTHFLRFSAEDRMTCYHIAHIPSDSTVVD